MPNLVDAFTMCLWFDVNVISRRNLAVAILSSFLFFVGWWILIDTAVVYPMHLEFSHFICGIMATISFIMVNTVSNEMLNGTGYSEGCMGSNGVKVWLFTGFVLGFAAMIAAVWLMIEEYNDHKEPAIALLLQNIMILLASLLYKFGRSDEQFGGGF